MKKIAYFENLQFPRLLLLALGLLALVLAPVAVADDHDDDNGLGMAGTWFNPDGPGTLQMGEDGNSLFSGSRALGVDGVLRTPWVGTWVKTGPRSFESSSINFTTDLDGNILAVTEFVLVGEMSKDRKSMAVVRQLFIYFCDDSGVCPNPLDPSIDPHWVLGPFPAWEFERLTP